MASNVSLKKSTNVRLGKNLEFLPGLIFFSPVDTIDKVLHETFDNSAETRSRVRVDIF